MNHLTKKQKITLATILVFILFLCLYLWKQNQKGDNLEIDLMGNIMENKIEESNTMILEKKSTIVVHITGEVIHPGIVKIKEDSRIADAIEAAGGITENADTNNVNLAYCLEDGQKIYIPNKHEKQEKIEIITSDAGSSIIEEDNMPSINPDQETNASISKVNINTATQTELESIPGIGPSTALKIIEYRKENGKFTMIEDIKNVNGIGDAKFEKMKDYICLK